MKIQALRWGISLKIHTHSFDDFLPEVLGGELISNKMSVCDLRRDNKTDYCLTVQAITDFVLTITGYRCKPLDNFCCIFVSGWWTEGDSNYVNSGNPTAQLEVRIEPVSLGFGLYRAPT